MPDNFQQTVDLREQMEKRKRPAPARKISSPLENIYLEDEKKDLATISRPKIKEAPVGLIRAVVFILAILIVAATAYFLFFRSKNAAGPAKAADWYAVVLKDDGMTYYGQVFDIKANPVVINNVYYDYDQNEAIKNNKPFIGTGNLRLVKQGKETYGPDSITSVYQSNISTLTQLKADSKVLQAILQYEK